MIKSMKKEKYKKKPAIILLLINPKSYQLEMGKRNLQSFLMIITVVMTMKKIKKIKKRPPYYPVIVPLKT